MNEQLVVKNFGPIKDATVDFKRVTVFIGPTGGGKSTLAKLGAIFMKPEYNSYVNLKQGKFSFLSDFSLTKFHRPDSEVKFRQGADLLKTIDFVDISISSALSSHQQKEAEKIVIKSKKNLKRINEALTQLEALEEDLDKTIIVNLVKNLINEARAETEKVGQMTRETLYQITSHFFPANRSLLPAVEYSWPGFLRDDIGLPKDILDFANNFSLSRKDVPELDIPFLNAKYLHQNGQDFIQVPGVETLFRLYEAASGIQSVTPLLVLLEHLSRNTEQVQSFIIEEPELNLYPTAQQGLLNWLVEKCTKGENDLTITTHSPYILSHLNLLLYAYYVGNKDEEKRQKVAVIIPEKYWLNPDEFAAYYVGDGRVRSLLDDETKLISQNGLDTVSGVQAAEFDQLLDINSGF